MAHLSLLQSFLVFVSNLAVGLEPASPLSPLFSPPHQHLASLQPTIILALKVRVVAFPFLGVIVLLFLSLLLTNDHLQMPGPCRITGSAAGGVATKPFRDHKNSHFFFLFSFTLPAGWMVCWWPSLCVSSSASVWLFSRCGQDSAAPKFPPGPCFCSTSHSRSQRWCGEPVTSAEAASEKRQTWMRARHKEPLSFLARKSALSPSHGQRAAGQDQGALGSCDSGLNSSWTQRKATLLNAMRSWFSARARAVPSIRANKKITRRYASERADGGTLFSTKIFSKCPWPYP